MLLKNIDKRVCFMLLFRCWGNDQFRSLLLFFVRNRQMLCENKKRNNPQLLVVFPAAEGYLWSVFVSSIILCTCSFFRFFWCVFISRKHFCLLVCYLFVSKFVPFFCSSEENRSAIFSHLFDIRLTQDSEPSGVLPVHWYHLSVSI